MARLDLIQFRRGTAAAWTSANPVLASGEPGVESDTGKWKVGDGTTAWVSLAYAPANGLTTNTAQTVSAVKTFTADPVFNANAIPESAVNGLAADLAAKATDSAVVHNTLYDANSILKADADNTPVVLAVPADTIPARITGVNGGVIAPATVAQLKTLLGYLTTDLSDFNAAVDARVTTDTQDPSAVNLTGGTIALAVTLTGRVIGVDLQAWDTDLDALAAIVGVQGDIIYRGASGWTKLAAGTAGQVLGTNGASANPSWEQSLGFGPWVSGSYNQVEGPTGTTATTQNQVKYTPLWVPNSNTISEFDVETTVAAGASGVLRVGIYASDANGRPGARVADFGTIDATVTAAILAKTGLSQAVTRGWYWLAVVSQGGASEPTIRTMSGTNRKINPTSMSSSANRSAYVQAGVSGALPDPAVPVLTSSAAAGVWSAVKAA